MTAIDWDNMTLSQARRLAAATYKRADKAKDALREAWSDEGEREWLALEREAEDLLVFAECGERP